MITKVDIQGIRGIVRGVVEGLAPLTVVVGPNNSGKSTVLESLLLTDRRASTETVLGIVDRRGRLGPLSIASLVPAGEATIKTYDDRGAADGVVLERSAEGRLVGRPYQSDPSLPSPIGQAPERFSLRFARDGAMSGSSRSKDDGAQRADVQLIDASRTAEDVTVLESLFSSLELAGRREWLVDLLRPLLPGLKDFRILVPDGRPTLFVEDASGRWPLAVSGDGFKRLFVMASRLVLADAALTLIEEPETYLHVGALGQVARLMSEATAAPAAPGLHKQVIVTTHSLEYIDAQFLTASDEALARSAIIRLSLVNGVLRSVDIPGPKVKELRGEIGEDLRR